jgi:tetratricopeptide (TPR) repeat protein
VAATLPAAYLLVHSSGDFLHAFPALTVPAFALAAAATAPVERPAVGRRAARAGVAAAALLIALTVVPLFLGARLMARAAETWPDRPGGALADLARAAEIDPLTAAAPLQRGIIALEAGRPDVAEASFRESLERDERGWFAQLELALLAARDGDRVRALALLAEVERLNPREPELPALRGEIEAGRAPDSLAVARRIVERGG